MKRRDFIFNLAILSGTAVAAPGLLAAGHDHCGGCCIGFEQASTLSFNVHSFNPANQQIVNTTGNERLDRQLGRALVRLARHFKVTPGFGLFEDGMQANAYAMPNSLLPDTHGTVLVGKNLFLDRLRRYDDAGMALLAICAHEFGHIFQFNTGYARRLRSMGVTARPVELHADFLAGYYMGILKAGNADLNFQGAQASFRDMGDYNLADPNHHGTPDQRVAAVETGYRLGKRRDVPISEAAKVGFAFVANLDGSTIVN